MICPHGLEIEVKNIGGINFYFHRDGTPCSLYNSLSPNSVAKIIEARNDIGEGLLLTGGVKEILALIHYGDPSKYLDIPEDMENSLGIFLNNATLIISVIESSAVNLKRIVLKKGVRNRLTSFFINDYASEVVVKLLNEFPKENEYVKTYGIKVEESSVYYGYPENSTPAYILQKWWPLTLEHRPYRPYAPNYLEYIFNFMRQMLANDLPLGDSKALRSVLIEMKKANMDIASLYYLGKGENLKEVLRRLV